MHKVLFSLLIVFVCASAFCGCVSAGDTWNGIELNWTWYSDDADDYYIYDAGSLAALSEKTSYNSSKNETFKGKTIHLMDNIDLSSICSASTDTSWKPIGSGKDWGKYKFCGNFDGNGKTISNLYINKPSDYYQGLFGYTNGANITNLTLTNVNVTGYQHVGGLAGWCGLDTAKTHFIDNCSVSGNISGATFIGGLIGQNYGIIKNCITIVYVSGDGCLGGLIGSNNCELIENCYANAEVSGRYNVGGLVGSNYRYTNPSDKITTSCIKNCFASGKVYGNENYVGGLVGCNHFSTKNVKLTISNCYAISEVIGGNNVGGLVGQNELAGYYTQSDTLSIMIIENTYAAGNVSGNDKVGGLIGYNELAIYNFYDTLYINNSSALNNYVNCSKSDKAGRIEGYHSNYDETSKLILFNNYGWKGIKNGENTFNKFKQLNQKNGKDVSNTNVWCSKSFFVNTLHWDFDKTWAIDKEDTGTNYPLPYLKSLGKYDSLREKVIYLMPDSKLSVTFNQNGGKGTMSDQELQYGVPQNLNPNTFTKDDWIFAGWNTKADGSGKNYKDEDSIIITAKTTLYAVWTKITNVTLYFNNTTSSSENQVVNISYDSGEFNKTLIKPIYKGHTFLGYNNSSNGGVRVINENLELMSNVPDYTDDDGKWINESKDVELWAIWKANVTDIKLNFNNGSDNSEYVSITYGCEKFNVTSLTKPTKPGYTFAGYNNSSNGGVRVINENLELMSNVPDYTDDDGKWINESSNVELWAAWSVNSYNVTFNSNNETPVNVNQTVSYGVGTPLNKFDTLGFSKAGHTFIGWNNSSPPGNIVNYEDGSSITIYKDTVLYAVWKANITNITLKFKNGSSAPNNKQAVSITYDTGTFNESLSPPTYAGYTFKGYFNESIGGVLVINDALKLVSNEVNYTSSGKWINTSSNITLYAHWIQNPPGDNSSGTSGSSTTYTGWVIYTVYFDSAGGSHIDNQTNLRYGEKVKKPDDPTRDGYIFDGWYTEDSYKWDFNNDTLNQSFTLYAKWKLIERPLSPTVKQHHCCWIAIIILLITAAVITAVIIKKKHDKKKDEENYDILS